LLAAGKKPPKLLVQREAIGKTGQRIEMRQPPQLLLRALALGDIEIGACHPAHRSVEIVHRGGRDPDMDEGAVLAHSLHLDVAEGFAADGAVEQRL
jgi:hypothetical protein